MLIFARAAQFTTALQANQIGVHFVHSRERLNLFAALPDRTSAKSRLMMLKMTLKCADVGHAAKVIRVLHAWL